MGDRRSVEVNDQDGEEQSVCNRKGHIQRKLRDGVERPPGLSNSAQEVGCFVGRVPTPGVEELCFAVQSGRAPREAPHACEQKEEKRGRHAPSGDPVNRPRGGPNLGHGTAETGKGRVRASRTRTSLGVIMREG